MNRVLQSLALFAALIVTVPALHSAATPTEESSSPEWNLTPWSLLADSEQQRILDEASALFGPDAPHGPEWRQAVGNIDLDVLVPRLHDAWVEQAAEWSGPPSQEQALQALVQVALQASSLMEPFTGLAVSAPGMPLPALPAPGQSGQPTAACQGLRKDQLPWPDGVDDGFGLLGDEWASKLVLAFLILSCPAFFAAGIVLVLVVVVAAPAIKLAAYSVLQVDQDASRMGDDFEREWNARLAELLEWADDFDLDGLRNLDEFRWELVPGCAPSFQNCRDYESLPSTGSGGDGWLDGPEVAYWNNPANDAALDLSTIGLAAVLDPDRNLNTDPDALPNVRDTDSDNDGLLDGEEAVDLGSYPEFADSDCATAPCTAVSETSYYATDRQGAPGTGDRIGDKAEFDAWAILGGGKRTIDFDGDGIANNLLDSDADNDGLLDGEEFTLGNGQVRPDLRDTEGDGLLDGSETAWSQDTDLDGLVNANDPDSDGDGMPDKWEVDHRFNMVDPTDALADRDGDLLNNLGEYQHATNPDDMDSEGTTLAQGDLLLDGEEINIYLTDPLHWDTDRDGMADRFEALYSLDPTNPSDAGLDPDADSFDLGNDGSIDKAWPNVDEYRYGRPAAYNEFTSGPWLQGTHPGLPDSDQDTATDGYEAYYGTNAHVPAELNADTDQDGLTWAEEVQAGTDANRPDTDGDGLCDGGRAANCRFPGFGTYGAGEEDYNSLPWTTDSDEDLLSDLAEAVRWDQGMSGQDADVDGDGLGGILDWDSDNDRLRDGEEVITYDTKPDLADSDVDNLGDGREVLDLGTLATKGDTDLDALMDGEEVDVHFTDPLLPDTDDDGLTDYEELGIYGTDPLLSDTDMDQLRDGWEALQGTQPRVPDGEADPDGDFLSNYGEQFAGSHPNDADTDEDSMLDGYEVTWGFNPTYTADGNWDFDGDSLTNLGEYQAKTKPTVYDTDGDGRSDGWEVLLAQSNPLLPDSDADGLDDGAEYTAWLSVSGTAWSLDHDADTLKALADPDSDNDGLNDRDEFQATRTKPHVQDTDGDGLTDYTEVVTFQGQYDPNRADTDGDGQRDNVEVALADSNGDYDQDGLQNSNEVSFGTDPTQPDSDCDGIEDGPEASYWNAWSTGGANLRNPDVDADGIQDGVEIGTTGTPAQALYRTLPDDWDTDGDGLGDNEEARNNVRVTCGGAAATLPAPSALGAPALPVGLPPVWTDAQGLTYSVDDVGSYILGGYGVHLYLPAQLPVGQGVAMTAVTPGPNGKLTNPMFYDTDGDGLGDGEEVQGTRNAYKAERSNANLPPGNTDPLVCDSDRDGLGDGLEAGMGPARAIRTGTDAICQQRDLQAGSVSNPNRGDTDYDSLLDGAEDVNANGWIDAYFDGYCFLPTAGTSESAVADGDTDDDGLSDDEETRVYHLNGGCFDSDFDGLSDGLEMARTSPVVLNGVLQTNTGLTVLGIGWPTWQPFQGTTQEAISAPRGVNLADRDADGILDGLEDLNHNGKLGDNGELRPDVPDTDGDGLYDGRELLIWGAPVDGKLTYGFQDYVRVRGSPQAGNTYDGSLFKTDPRDATTDFDNIEDGFDINPKGDAWMSLAFNKFWQYDYIDSDPRYGLNHMTDLKLRLTVETGVGDFKVDTLPLEDFGNREGVDFHELNVDAESKRNPTTATPAGMATIWDAGRMVRFDLPEDVTHFGKARDFKVHVRLQAIDDDYEFLRDEAVDISARSGHTEFYDERGIDLAYLGQEPTYSPVDTANGNDDGVPGDNNDGKITYDLSTTLIPYFAKNLLGTQPLGTGTCLGGVDGRGRPCDLR